MSGIAHQRASPAPVTGGAGGQYINADEQKNKDNKPVQKKSLDYILRSGLAGGAAGCAVSARSCKWKWKSGNTTFLLLFPSGIESIY